MEIIVILFWVLCAIICNQQAKQKGLNVGLWTVLGLLFGIFAVIFVFLQSSKTTASR